MSTLNPIQKQMGSWRSFWQPGAASPVAAAADGFGLSRGPRSQGRRRHGGPRGTASRRLLRSSAEGEGTMRAPRRADPGLFISAAGSAPGRSPAADGFEGTRRLRFQPRCAAVTQTGNKASFFMQRCTVVNTRKACLGGVQVSNQFQNGSPVPIDVYLIYIFFPPPACQAFLL